MDVRCHHADIRNTLALPWAMGATVVMKQWIAKQLLKLVTFYLGYDPEEKLREYKKSNVVIPKEVAAIMATVKKLCIAQEITDSPNRWKRVYVMTKLIKAGVKERDANLAIELAIREIR